MPERATVIECRAEEVILRRCSVPAGMIWIKLRPDRALGVVLGEGGKASARWACTLREANPELVVLDVSPGWVALRATNLSAVWANELDGRPCAGLVAGVPAIVMPVDDGITVLVEASYTRHLAARIAPEALK